MQFDASFDYDTENSQTVNSVSSTFSQVLIPSNVTLAMAPSRDPTTNAPIPSFIDCNEWTVSCAAPFAQLRPGCGPERARRGRRMPAVCAPSDVFRPRSPLCCCRPT